MASESLSVREEHVRDVIRVIRAGLEHARVPKEVRDQLRRWCAEEEQYLDDCEASGDDD